MLSSNSAKCLFAFAKGYRTLWLFFSYFLLRFYSPFLFRNEGRKLQDRYRKREIEQPKKEEKNRLMLSKRRRIIHNTGAVSEGAAKKIMHLLGKKREKNILPCFASAPFGCVFLVLATKKKKTEKTRKMNEKILCWIAAKCFLRIKWKNFHRIVIEWSKGKEKCENPLLI